MAGDLTAENFRAGYKHLNGVNPIDATRADIIRSLLTVGYLSRRDAANTVGRWRELMMVAMGMGYLDSHLRTTSYFNNLEASEKVGVSFLFGEAFTHWFAQSKMSIPYLQHVQGLKSCRWGTPTSPAIPKKGASTPNLKSRPDFIGVLGTQYHVFESKGRQRRPGQAAIADALGQASALVKVKGKMPKTRSASFFMLKPKGVEGYVSDPPGDRRGLTLSFDTLELLRKSYAVFLRGEMRDLPEVGQDYVGRQIADEVFFGIDKNVYRLVTAEVPASEGERNTRSKEIFAVIESRREAYLQRRDERISPGIDGTILLERNEPPRRRTKITPKLPDDLPQMRSEGKSLGDKLDDVRVQSTIAGDGRVWSVPSVFEAGRRYRAIPERRKALPFPTLALPAPETYFGVVLSRRRGKVPK